MDGYVFRWLIFVRFDRVSFIGGRQLNVIELDFCSQKTINTSKHRIDQWSDKKLLFGFSSGCVALSTDQIYSKTTRIVYSQVDWDRSSERQNDLFIISAARDACWLTVVDGNLGEIFGTVAVLRGWNNDAVTTVWRGTNDGFAIIVAGGKVFPNESLGCIDDDVRMVVATTVVDCGVTRVTGALNSEAPFRIFSCCCFALSMGIVLNTDAVTVFGLAFATTPPFNWFAIKTRRIGCSGTVGKSTDTLRLMLALLLFSMIVLNAGCGFVVFLPRCSSITSDSELFVLNVSVGFDVNVNWAQRSAAFVCSFNFSLGDNALNASNWRNEYTSFSFIKSLQSKQKNGCCCWKILVFLFNFLFRWIQFDLISSERRTKFNRYVQWSIDRCTFFSVNFFVEIISPLKKANHKKEIRIDYNEKKMHKHIRISKDSFDQTTNFTTCNQIKIINRKFAYSFAGLLYRLSHLFFFFWEWKSSIFGSVGTLNVRVCVVFAQKISLNL